MPVQSEQILEEGLIKTLIENSYERVILNDENELKSNFKAQLEKHNTDELKRHGRTSFTAALVKVDTEG